MGILMFTRASAKIMITSRSQVLTLSCMLVACSAMEEKSAPADTVPPNPELSPCCEAHEKARTKNETRYLYRGTEWNTFYQTDEIRVGQRVAVFYKTHEIRGNWYLAEITS